MFYCKKCSEHVSLSNNGIGYCNTCKRYVRYEDVIPDRCIDPCMQYCQCCPYGYISYPEFVETREDIEFFDTTCIYNLEATAPTEEQLVEFNKWYKNSVNKKECI